MYLFESLIMGKGLGVGNDRLIDASWPNCDAA